MKGVRVGELEMRQGTRSGEKGGEECNRGTHCVVSKDCRIFTINKRRLSPYEVLAENISVKEFGGFFRRE